MKRTPHVSHSLVLVALFLLATNRLVDGVTGWVMLWVGAVFLFLGAFLGGELVEAAAAAPDTFIPEIR